jgi:hypothetical protein
LARPSHLLAFLADPHSGQHLPGAWRIPHVVQIERYTFKKVKGHWRIDAQAIQGDHVIGRTI